MNIETIVWGMWRQDVKGVVVAREQLSFFQILKKIKLML
jgi:hypothetical protein